MRDGVTRGRRDTGQNIMEYAGAVVLVAGVVGLVVASPIGDAIPAAFSCTVRSVIPGGDAGQCPEGSGEGRKGGAESQDLGGPTAGPAIGDGRGLLVLPYPGEAGLGGTASKKKYGISATLTQVYGRSRAALQRIPVDLDGDGRIDCYRLRKRTQLSVATTLEATLEASAGKKTKVELETGAGSRSTYSMIVSKKQARKIRNGKMEPPNPLDPRTIPPHDGIVLNDDSYVKLGLDASYRSLRASLGYERGHRISSGIRRKDKDHVSIYVGDAKLVNHAMELGIGGDEFGAAYFQNRSFSTGKLREVTLDISTPGGRAAYRRFINAGTLPKAGSAGVSDVASVGRMTSSNKSGFKITFNDNKAGGYIDSDYAVRTIKHRADGSTQYSWSYKFGGVTRDIRRTVTPSGKTIKQRFALTLNDVDARILSRYYSQSGHGERKFDGEQDVSLSFTPEGLLLMRRQEIRDVAKRASQQGYSHVDTPREVRSYMRKHPDHVGALPWRSNVAELIGTAKGPHEVFLALQNGWSQDGNAGMLLFNLAGRSGSVCPKHYGGAKAEAASPLCVMPARFDVIQPADGGASGKKCRPSGRKD